MLWLLGVLFGLDVAIDGGGAEAPDARAGIDPNG